MFSELRGKIRAAVRVESFSTGAAGLYNWINYPARRDPHAS
jgi:hypothetical protein